jgi:tRNA A37 threonylcarbamoyladenosine modification protein TsaB
VCAQNDSALDVMRRACEEKGEEALFAQVDAAASALEVALAGLQKLAEGEADDPLSLTPLYLAPSSAERVRFGL